jgi:hypothetical protein
MHPAYSQRNHAIGFVDELEHLINVFLVHFGGNAHAMMSNFDWRDYVRDVVHTFMDLHDEIAYMLVSGVVGVVDLNPPILDELVMIFDDLDERFWEFVVYDLRQSPDVFHERAPFVIPPQFIRNRE